MSNKKINVLSIDYDYFQIITKKDIKHYPDGIDLEPHISSIVWMSKYEIHKDLENIKNDKERIKLVSDIIKKNNHAKKLISYTHKDIYKFILDNTKENEQINIYNLDTHHDMFNKNKELDCGNWISHIKKIRPHTDIYWYANPLTPSIYGLEGYEDYLHTKDIRGLLENKYDLIFLCKSPNWVPPHLYNEYDKLVSIMEKQ